MLTPKPIMEIYRRNTYPGVIHQGDKDIGPIAIAKAKLDQAREEYKKAKYNHEYDIYFNTDKERDKFYEIRDSVN